jgi:hypothetical protein
VSHVLKVAEGATPEPVASAFEGMRILIASATVLATLSLAGTAFAQTAGSTEPVSDEALNRPVSVDVAILDAGGATVDTLSCEWSTGGPADDDHACLKFQSDPQVAFAAIEDAGGVRAEQHTVVGGTDSNAGDMAITYSKRADGTWLIRSKGIVRGELMHFGRVCTADGQSCVRWDADGAKHAKKSVRAAASKLKHRR